jgi:uncharacterized protein (TIGR00369 family)
MDGRETDVQVVRQTRGLSLIARIPQPHENTRVDPRAFALLVGSTGLSRLRWAGKYVLPPVERLTGIVLDDFASGSATYSMPVSGWLRWEDGVVPEGVLAVIADSAHTGAVLSAADPATGFLTAGLSLEFASRIPAGADRIIARGKILSAHGAHVLSQVEISDSDGNLACISTARSSLLPLPSSLSEPPDQPTLAGLEDAEADLAPFRLEVEGQGLTPPGTTQSGLEFLQALAAGQYAEPPLKRLTGLALLSADEGSCTFGVDANPWLCSFSGSIQGGMTGLVIERAAWGAILSGRPAGESCRTLDLKINYFHQMVQGSGTLRAIGEVLHRSRRLAVASVRVEDEEGRSLACATATVAVTRAAA